MAADAQDVREGPGIVQRLNRKERHFNILVIVFGEHAFPLIILVRLNTFICRGVLLDISNTHEILEKCSVAVCFGLEICRIQENARIR